MKHYKSALSQERGSAEAYSVLAKALGLLKEVKKEAYEEREAVWVYTVGEVQPRQATVVEEVDEEAEEVLCEFWDDEEPPSYISKTMIRKAFL